MLEQIEESLSLTIRKIVTPSFRVVLYQTKEDTFNTSSPFIRLSFVRINPACNTALNIFPIGAMIAVKDDVPDCLMMNRGISRLDPIWLSKKEFSVSLKI